MTPGMHHIHKRKRKVVKSKHSSKSSFSTDPFVVTLLIPTDVGSVDGTYLKTADEPQHISGTCVMSLAQNDKVQLVVMSDDDASTVKFYHYQVTIKPFFADEVGI